MTQEEQTAYEAIMARLQSPLTRWYRGDPYGYAELCADDVTYYAPNTEGHLEGLGALKALYATFQGKVNVPRYEIINPKFRFYGDMAILLYGLHEYGNGDAPTYRWDATEVYRRSDDQWRIIHAHWSPTGKTPLNVAKTT